MANGLFSGTALTTQAPGYVQNALNQPFSFTNTAAATNPGQIQQQAADTAYQSATRYLDPQFQRQQAGMENQLANQGITRGSEAWNNAVDQFNANKNTAYDQARSQAYTQGLSGANQALNTMFQQSALDVSKENAKAMADAMKTGGMFSLGSSLLGSQNGLNNLGSLLKSGGSGLSSLLSGGSSVLKGLGGLFGTGGTSLDSLVGGSDMAKLIGLDGATSSNIGSLSLDPEFAKLIGLDGGSSATAGVDPTGGYLTALLAADKLSGGKLGVGNTVNDLVGGATNAISDAASGLGNVVSSFWD